ncbi:hypothetical protein pb186bvf_008444 [Paramecium bursaria]
MDRTKEEHVQPLKQKTSTPSFLIKTYDILENPEYRDIISWTEDGLAFVVRNVNELAEKVLPNHFKHNNYASFVRQLNMYDFHKIKNDGGENEFRHRFFQRGNKHLLCEIRRKQGEQMEQYEDRNQNSSPSNESVDPDMSKLKNDYQFFLNEMLGIKGKQHELQKALILIMTQNDHLINENKLLWQEIKRIRETDERKIDTLSYLLATFITNMNQNGQPQAQQENKNIENHLEQQFNGMINFPMQQMQQMHQMQFKDPPQQEKSSKQAQQEHSSFLEKMMKQQQQQDIQLQQIKTDISQYDSSFMKKNCNPYQQQGIRPMEQNYLVQQNSNALLQQLISLSQQQQQQQSNQFQSQQGNNNSANPMSQFSQNMFQNLDGRKSNNDFPRFPFM